MKKCPRCQHEINDDAKYCPYCGLDLENRYRPIKKRPQNKATTYLLYVIIFFSFITIPLLYSRVLGELGNNINLINNKKGELPEIVEQQPTQVIAAFDTLGDFNQKFTNVSPYVENIENYEKKLSQKGKTFDKKYIIQVLDNYDILYRLTYTIDLSQNYQIKVVKDFDRSHSTNSETITFIKKDAKTFEDLLLTKQEQQIVNTYMDNPQAIEQVIHSFSQRKTEFETKKEKLGHYGIGTYQKNISFVAKRYDKVYQAVLTYQKPVKDYLS